jgi:curved DNA-binding protein CbpA
MLFIIVLYILTSFVFQQYNLISSPIITSSSHNNHQHGTYYSITNKLLLSTILGYGFKSSILFNDPIINVVVAAAGGGKEKSHYEILGVPKNADDNAIKKAYRKLAKKYHPDRHQDPKKKEKAEQLFIKVAKAYETLIDPEKRRHYDLVGEDDEIMRQQQQQQQQAYNQYGSGGGSSGGSGSTTFSFGGGGGFDPFSIFESMFGTRGFQQQQHRSGSGGSGGGAQFGGFPRQSSQGGAGFFTNNPDIVEISMTNADKYISKTARASDGRAWVVLFYSPQCGHCAAMKNDFIRFAAKIKGAVRVGAVNCLSNMELCQRYRVQGYPTIYGLLPTSGSSPKEYHGNRNAASLWDFSASILPDNLVHVVKSKEKALQVCGNNPKKSCVILFTDKSTPTPLYKAVAMKHASNAMFTILAGGTNPAQLVIDGERYTGQLTYDALNQFIASATHNKNKKKKSKTDL